MFLIDLITYFYSLVLDEWTYERTDLLIEMPRRILTNAIVTMRRSNQTCCRSIWWPFPAIASDAVSWNWRRRELDAFCCFSLSKERRRRRSPPSSPRRRRPRRRPSFRPFRRRRPAKGRIRDDAPADGASGSSTCPGRRPSRPSRASSIAAASAVETAVETNVVVVAVVRSHRWTHSRPKWAVDSKFPRVLKLHYGPRNEDCRDEDDDDADDEDDDDDDRRGDDPACG